MQTLGYTKEECLDFFINCVDQLLFWRKIQYHRRKLEEEPAYHLQNL